MDLDGFTSEQSGALQFSEENPKKRYMGQVKLFIKTSF